MGVSALSKRSTSAEQDLFIRLFFRFLLCYAVLFAAGYLAAAKGLGAGLKELTLSFSCLFVPLGLLGGFSKIPSLYLSVLTVLKAFGEAWLFRRILPAVGRGELRLWVANAALLLLGLSLFLYASAAATACRFAHKTYTQNLRLIFSRDGIVFLLKSLCLTALALILYLCHSHLADHFPW